MWTKVESSNLDAYKYDADTQVFTAQFKNGAEYEYPDVSQSMVNDLETVIASGESVGKWFAVNMRKRPCTKVKS